MLTDQLSNEQYHAHKAISSSAVKMVHSKSLLHWKKNVYKDSAAFALGTAVHSELLEPDKNAVLCGPDTRRGKAWAMARTQAELEDKTLLIKEDYDACQGMVQSVLSNTEAYSLLKHSKALKEVSVFSKDPLTGLELKARPDLFIPEEGILLDVKTTRDASPKNGGFERQFFSLGYHVQAAFYTHVLELEGYEIKEFIFLAVEKEPPYAVQMHYLHPEVLKFGMLQVRDVLGQMKDVEGKDVDSTGWPARNNILLPKWMKATDRMNEMTDYTITDVQAQWPKINRPYRFDNAERKSISCDPLDDGAAYTLQFRMDTEQAKALYKEMANAYAEAREDNWPEKVAIPFKKDSETGMYEGKSSIKASYNKEVTTPPMQVDAEGNKLPKDFMLTTGSTVNIAVAFFPYCMKGEAGVALRLRAVQVVSYKPMEERNPFNVVKGYVHKSDNPFSETKAPTIDLDSLESSEAPTLQVVKKRKAPAKKADVETSLDSVIENW